MDEWLDFSELVDKAQELIDLGFYEEALQLLDQYSMIYTDEWELYYLYSRIYTDKNLAEEAIPFLHKGLRIEKTNADCLLGLFYAHSMLNQVKKGARYLLRAAKFHPGNEMVLSTLVWYHTEINEIDTAIEIFERLRNNGTANPEVFRNGGLAFERAGQHDSAEQCFKTALDLNPQYDEVRDMLADHYLILDQSTKAVALYQQALKSSPRNIRILSRLVFCYSQADQKEKATALAKETIRIYPNSPTGYVDLAYVYLNNDEFDRALELAERALDISPIEPEAFRVKAIAYSEKKELKLAQDTFQSAIAMDSENVEIIRDYYHHLRSAENYEEMEKWVQTAIKLEQPYCMEDYWFMADFFREKGQNLKALHYLHKAHKSMPGEKELIPPIIDILLERGHTTFSLPFLISYVEKSGWNDIMNEFAHHKKMRGKWAQEGIRFLRFWGQQHSVDYRKYVFTMYLKKFSLIFLLLIMSLSSIPTYLLFGSSGLIFLSLSCCALFITFIGTKYIIKREKTAASH